MGLLSTTTTSLTGMQAAETTIDVVGNNVANSNTVGFKESKVLFATQFSQTQSVGSAPTGNNGGTNPRQIGLGVKVAEISPDFTQGTIEISSNPLDLAIQGDGFFIVEGANPGQKNFTRNGQFSTNNENEIVTASGNRVLGYGINENFEIVDGNDNVVPLAIPLGGSQVAQQTRNVTLTGNLLPDKTVASVAEIIESIRLGDSNREVPINLANNAVSELQEPNVTAATAGGVANGGSALPAGTYHYKVSFVDPNAYAGHNEGPASAALGPVTVASGNEIQLANIPAPSDPAVYSQMRIYRSTDGITYNLVEQVATNTSYTDDNASATTQLDDGDLDSVNYSYFITYANSQTETRPNAQSATVTISNNNRRVRLENIPSPTDAEWDEIRIYRNVNNQPGNFYLVDTLPVTGSPVDYIDTKSDNIILDTANQGANAQLLDRNGPKILTNTRLVDLSSFNGTGYVNLFEPGTLKFTGAKGSPTALNLPTKELEITGGANGTTVQELISFMSQALGIETDAAIGGNPGTGVTSDSRLFFESNFGDKNELSIDESSFSLIPTGGGTPRGVPIDFTTTVEGNGEGSTTEIVVFDSLGIPLNVRLTTVLVDRETNATTYRWFATTGDNQVATGLDTTIGTGLITYDGTGAFSSSTNSNISIQRQDVASVTPVNIALDFSQITAVSKQNGTSDIQMSNQDGFPSGTLASFSITESGLVKGVYTNGVTRDLGQVVMAKFTNSGGLQQVGNSLFAAGVNSGEPFLGTPGEDGIGSITAGAVELSNSDIGQNLVKLILASTQYRGGTRVITTAQQLLDELLSLRR